MIFINTRPSSRANNLTTFLQSQGIKVVELPLLELVACQLFEQEKSHLTQVNSYHALVFVSETAVSYFFNYIQTHQISLNPNLTFIAVGQKTAHVFNQFWQKNYPTPPNLLTPSEFNLPENNEGLLQLSIIQSLKKGEKVLLLKGKDGRELLKNTLLIKGVTVDEMDFYQRVFPPRSVQIFQDFCQNASFFNQKIVLITSLTAWENWQRLIQSQFNPNDFGYVVLQSRIAECMGQMFQENLSIKVIDDLQPTTIFNALRE